MMFFQAVIYWAKEPNAKGLRLENCGVSLEGAKSNQIIGITK